MVDEKSGVHLVCEDINETSELIDDDLPTPKLREMSPLGRSGDSSRGFVSTEDRSVYVEEKFVSYYRCLVHLPNVHGNLWGSVHPRIS
jgi:hypothetical protein